MQPNQTSHPASLPIFFATEMWERYGFYVVQTLLVLYLTQRFQWNDSNVYTLVGSFTALTYASPIVGGWIADHFLGQKRTIIAGGMILFLCYFLLGFVAADNILIFSLAGIAVGTGLFKPNISSLLGNEYAPNSPGRESGFTVFYMGITSGIILGCVIPSQLNYFFGWSVSFISAAVGMLIGLAVFLYGLWRYPIHDYHAYHYDFNKVFKAGLVVAGVWLLSFCTLHMTILADFVFFTIVLASIIYFIYSIKKAELLEGRKTMVIGLLCLISVIFWTFYFQMFLSFTLFIARVVEPTLWGIQFPPPFYVSVQSFGAIFFGLFLTRRKNSLSSGQPLLVPKFLFAMFFMMLAFVSIALLCRSSETAWLLSPLLFLPVYLLISLAELFLYPIGLSAITVLSPTKKVSTMMGIFFVSLGVGGFLAGKLANLAAVLPGETPVLLLKAHYAAAFTRFSYLVIAALVVCALLTHRIRQLLAEPDASANDANFSDFCLLPAEDTKI